MTEISRIIPVLLLRGTELVKTKQFSQPVYIGDVLNSLAIFNSKGVDEIIVLDIDASRNGTEPNIGLIGEMASECFMPMCYGGGVRDVKTAERIMYAGVEKVALNTALWKHPDVVGEISRNVGRQSVVGSLDYFERPGSNISIKVPQDHKALTGSIVDVAKYIEDLGVGELLIQSVTRDGMRCGYNIDVLKEVTDAVKVPTIALGGADGLDDFAKVISHSGVAAAAAGSAFVLYGDLQSVLITTPTRKDFLAHLQKYTPTGHQ